jgi:hypothetical protein
MKNFILVSILAFLFCTSCKKDPVAEPVNISESTINENTIVVSADSLISSLVSVDSTKIIFNENGSGVSKIKVGSILVSDIRPNAPNGFLRKVTAISSGGGKKVFTTTQATLCDAVKDGKVKFSQTFTDNDLMSEDLSGKDIAASGRISNLSLTIPYQRTISGVEVTGELKLEPTFEFELDINSSSVSRFKTDLILKNTNTILGEVQRSAGKVQGQVILKTYQLRPITIMLGVVPIPVAKQWIVIILGADGEVSAKISGSAVNTNTLTLGVEYRNNTWKNLYDVTNSLKKISFDYEGKAKVESWVQARYEIRPYGLKTSKVYLQAKGSVIAEVKTSDKNPCKYTLSLDWGIDLSTKAQVQVFDKAILDYGGTIFAGNYSIYKKEVNSLKVKTDSLTGFNGTSAKCGGTLTDSIKACNTPVLKRGVCYSITSKPTITSTITSDGTGTGTFTSKLENLIAGKTYFVRAYALTPTDTIYGNERILKTKYAVGDTAQGGIVFYVDKTGLHGMVYPMPKELPSFKALWSRYYTRFEVATGIYVKTDSIIGSGLVNTKAIVADYGGGEYTAQICENLESGGFSDWFLPSIYELAEILYNKDKLPGIVKSRFYRSSTMEINCYFRTPRVTPCTNVLRGVILNGFFVWGVWGINQSVGDYSLAYGTLDKSAPFGFDTMQHGNGGKNDEQYFIPVRNF